MDNNIIIELKYSFKEKDYKKIKISPLDYFDLENESEIDIDSTPKFLELKDYLPEKSDAHSIILLINNLINKRALKVYERKWEGNYFSFSQEFLGNKFIDSEIIFQIKESDKQKLQTIKFLFKDDDLQLITHSLYNISKDFSEDLI